MDELDTLKLTRKICDDLELFLTMRTQTERQERFKEAASLISKQYDLKPNDLIAAAASGKLDQDLNVVFEKVNSLEQKSDSESGTYEDEGEAVGGVIGAAAGAGMGDRRSRNRCRCRKCRWWSYR